MHFKILLLVLIFHIVHSNYEDLEIDSTTSHESCVEPDETTSESNCFCYDEPENEFEYSICAPAIDTTTTAATTATPFICPVKGVEAYPRDNYRLVQGKCFYFERTYMNWQGARDNCKQKGGKLFEPKNVAELNKLPQLLTMSPNMAILRHGLVLQILQVRAILSMIVMVKASLSILLGQTEAKQRAHLTIVLVFIPVLNICVKIVMIWEKWLICHVHSKLVDLFVNCRKFVNIQLLLLTGFNETRGVFWGKNYSGSFFK